MKQDADAQQGGVHQSNAGTAQVLVPPLGEALNLTILLSDWNKFGLTERVCYHFDLIETLTSREPVTVYSRSSSQEDAPQQDDSKAKSSLNLTKKSFCGVVSLLECVPTVPPRKVTVKKRRAFHKRVRDFNARAKGIREAGLIPCHEPRHFPLPISPNTRVTFVYEVTRIAFVLDASPTLTTTFGNVENDACCSLDRLPRMVRTFFRALVQPIPRGNNTSWKPRLAVTVVAVFPQATGKPETTVLVRDFSVHDASSAKLLADKISIWAMTDVENEIAKRISSGGRAGARSNRGGYGSWMIPSSSSRLDDLLEAGSVALSLLPFEARPGIVVATDCMSVASDNVLDFSTSNDRVDTPICVLDLSSPNSHVPTTTKPTTAESVLMASRPDLLTFDPGGPGAFPLHWTDNSETLHAICNATGGCFLDLELLQETARTIAGEVPSDSNLHPDHYISSSRRSLRPSSLQWYILFLVSPLSPRSHLSWGKLVSPRFMRMKQQASKGKLTSYNDLEKLVLGNEIQSGKQAISRSSFSFSNYVLSPVRIKGLLMMRIKEGYCARQYGPRTLDFDRISVQLSLPVDSSGTVLHYELQYKASLENAMVGVARIKIEISGDMSFVESLKQAYLSHAFEHGQEGRQPTVSETWLSKLCRVLRWFQKEDIRQSWLSQTEWSENSPLLKRLSNLNRLQRYHHFRREKFDVLSVGEAVGEDEEGHGLYNALANWSTQTIIPGQRYVKQISSTETTYCVVEVSQSQTTSRLFTLTFEIFGGVKASTRLPLLISLKNVLAGVKSMVVLPLLMGEYLAEFPKPTSSAQPLRQRMLENQYHHETWELSYNPEFLPLLIRRMTEIGNYWILDATESRAFFVKFVSGEGDEGHAGLSPSDLHMVQYQVEVMPAKIIINIYMDTERAFFFPFASLVRREEASRTNLFERRVEAIRNRDQECCDALRSRTNLLSAFDDDGQTSGHVTVNEEHEASVERLLSYAYEESRKLRFFHEGAGTANRTLEELTETLMLSGNFGTPVAKLFVDSSKKLGGVEEGIWFLLHHDTHTLSLARLSNKEELDPDAVGESLCYRRLSFYTVSTSDLYFARDGTGEGTSDRQHVRHWCVSHFADGIVGLHGQNYARAAYRALRDESVLVQSMNATDVDHVLDQCEFSEALSIVLPKEIHLPTHGDGVADSKLCRVLRTMFSSLPTENHECYLFFRGEETSEEDIVHVANALIAEDLDDIENEDEHSIFSPSTARRPITPTHLVQKDLIDVPVLTPFTSPPIFIMLKIHGEPASLADVAAIEKSSTLEILISTDLGGKKKHAADSTLRTFVTHSAVVHELKSRLNAYLAEESLERSRRLGPEISDADLATVKSCLRKAQNVASLVIPIDVYVEKRDGMVHASAPAGSEAEVDNAFLSLGSELQKSTSPSLTSASQGDYFVNRTDDAGSVLFWCFLGLKRTMGVVSVEVYHPDGLKAAYLLATQMKDRVIETCDRVNRILLLKSLHRTRNASSLLVSNETESQEMRIDCENHVVKSTETDDRPAGRFACPVRYRTRFPLYHRCTANQVVQKVEASMLHNFAVSNRRGLFVYKDETDAIFYMRLVAEKADLEFIELLVHGVNEPGPSITKQLVQLLHKRLLSIAVDSLSLLLTKNPLFNWKSADLDFVRSFEQEWNSIEHDDKYFLDDFQCTYEFPSSVYDPLMILVYFRQNLGGSTYFHRLHKVLEGESLSTEEATPNIRIGPANGTAAYVDWQEFEFFFNNCPSPLDPSLQNVSTLTSKGKTWAAAAGNGIALINVSLVGDDGLPLENVDVGRALSVECESSIDVSVESMRVKRIEKHGRQRDQRGPFLVRVQITSTALSRKALHSWLELTLNQVLVAWSIERQIEKSQVGLLKPKRKPVELPVKQNKTQLIDEINIGMPGLISMMGSSYGLPHPAINQLRLGGMVEAPNLARMTQDILEKCVLPTLLGEKSVSLDVVPAVSIIRSSRNMSPSSVKSFSDGENGRVRIAVSRGEESVSIVDTQIDCPEYVCFYCFQEYSKRDESTFVDGISRGSIHPQLSSRLFREVNVGDGLSEKKSSNFAQVLNDLKAASPSLFRRSLAFVLRVCRENRTLLTYNWGPSKVELVTSRMKELESSTRVDNGLVHSQQAMIRLGLVSQTSTGDGRVVTGTMTSTPTVDAQEKKELESKTDDSHQTRKTAVTSKRKPTPSGTIRRPKLIGKSVEGAAMQAIAASRKRASSRSVVSSRSVASSLLRKKTGSAKAMTSVKESRRVNMTETDGSKSRSEQVGPERRIEDPMFKAFTKDFDLAVQQASLRWRLPRTEIMSDVLSKLWNERNCKLTQLMTEFVLTQSIPHLHQSFILFSLPPRALHKATVSLGQTLIDRRGFQMLKFDTANNKHAIQEFPRSTMENAVYLYREIRRTREFRYMLVVRIRTTNRLKDRTRLRTLHFESWIVTLRASDASPNKRRIRRRKTILQKERDAARLDRALTSSRNVIILEAEAFNLAASFVYDGVQSKEMEVGYVAILREMIERCRPERQKRLRGIRYRVLEAKLTLPSCRDRYIDMCASTDLLRRVKEDGEELGFLRCGRDEVCTCEPFPLLGTKTHCFLTPGDHDGTSLQLVLLCRTEGRILEEYVSRDGKNSPFMVRIQDRIVVESARVVRDCLRAAAIAMHRDSLWNSLTLSSRGRSSPSLKEYDELRSLVCVTTMADWDDSLKPILESKDMGLNWRVCCASMREDPMMKPNWSFAGISPSDSYATNVLYLNPRDVIITFKVSKDGNIDDCEMLSREKIETDTEISRWVSQVLTNYLLHYIWANI